MNDVMLSVVPVFLINLERDSDRLQSMTNELNRIGLAFERVPAVYGTQMPDYLRRYFLDAEGRIDSTLKSGEVGCYASHLHIHHEIFRRGIDFALVLEDDLSFCDSFTSILDELLKLPRNWDIIRLSNAAKRSVVATADIAGHHKLVKYSRIPNNTGAYLISAQGATKFTRWDGARRNPVDVDLRRGWRFDMRTFGVLPPPVQSNIVASRIDSMEDRGLGRTPTVRKALSRVLTGRTEFGFSAFRRIAYSIRFLGWRDWLRCTASDLYATIGKRLGLSRRAPTSG